MKNFRHSFVSNNHHSGMPIMYISRLVGHSNYKTTSERYSNMFDDKGAKYLDKASEHLKNIRISSEQKQNKFVQYSYNIMRKDQKKDFPELSRKPLYY